MDGHQSERPSGKCLMGYDHLTQTLHILELEKRSWEVLAKSVGLSFEELQRDQTLSDEEIKNIAETMYAEDLIQQGGKSGLVAHPLQLKILLTNFASGLSALDPHWFRKLASILGAN